MQLSLAIDILGTIASLAGLGWSWAAWCQAKSAKLAAEDAAKAVRTQDAAHEFSKLAMDAKDLLASVQDGRKDRAIAAANDLVHLLSIVLSRRRGFLPSNPDLELRIKNLRIVSNDLSTAGFPTEQKQLSALVRRCEQIHATVCEITGFLERNSEGS